jgi:hypothetical protein
MPAKATKAAKTAATPAAEEPTEPAPKKKAAPAKAVKTQAEPPAAAPAPAEPAQDESGDAGDESAPMNRAERRAKGRGKSTAQVPGGRGKVTGGHGPAHTQRNWASRRSG